LCMQVSWSVLIADCCKFSVPLIQFWAMPALLLALLLGESNATVFSLLHCNQLGYYRLLVEFWPNSTVALAHYLHNHNLTKDDLQNKARVKHDS
jgi:hypothetical protein